MEKLTGAQTEASGPPHGGVTPVEPTEYFILL